MSGSQEPRAGVVFPEDQGTFMALMDKQSDAIGFEELNEAFTQTPEVLMMVAQFSQPIGDVQMVCNLPQLIIELQQHITDMQNKQFLHPQCDHTELTW
jgi:hypothetical protein